MKVSLAGPRQLSQAAQQMLLTKMTTKSMYR
jgi:hypothetical protein